VNAVRSLRVAGFLALRSLVRGNAWLTAMTMVLLAVVFVGVMFLPSLIAAETDAINAKIRDTMTSDLIIAPEDGASAIDDASGYVTAIANTDGVAAAATTLRVGSEIAANGISGTWPVDAIVPEDYGAVFATPGNLIEGEPLRAGDAEGILLGLNIAGAGHVGERSYGTSLQTVHAGDTVTVTLLGGVTGDFVVRGIYDNKFPFSDGFAFVGTAASDRLLPQLGDIATRVYVRADPGTDTAMLQDRIAGLRDDVTFQDPEQVTAAVQEQLEIFDLIDRIMRVISLLVAAITVLIITYIDVTNRRRQIGIERAIGIRASAIVGGYVIKSLVNGAVGAALGWVLFRFVVVPLTVRWPFVFPNGPVSLAAPTATMAQTAIVLVVVSGLAALLPSVWAVRMRILDAIWGR